MAKFNKDSFSGTLGVVVAISLICSVIVAGAAVGLKPTQDEQKHIDKQRNILSVAGLLEKNTDVGKVYAERIEPRVIDLATGDYVEAPDFNAALAIKDPNQSIQINQEDDVAGIRVRPKYSDVYLVKGEDGKINQVILPMHSKGLWSMIYAFVSLQPDGNTLNGLTYYQQGETAGLGGEIANPLWQAQFAGKKLYNEEGKVAIRVVRGAGSDKTHGVDGLSGASITTKGVQNSFVYWFGQNGFAPYLAKLKAEGVK